MTEYQPEYNKDAKPAKYLYQLFAGIELIEGVCKEDADKGKPSPAYYLK